MIRRRKKDKHFTQINNDTLRNPSLSLKAKGLLAVMMTNAEDWTFYMAQLQTLSADGREAHQNAMKELEQHRYVVRLRMQRPNGTFKGWQYIVDDEPILDIEPGTVVMVEGDDEPTDGFPVNRLATDERENRQSGKPSDGKPATKNKKDKNINSQEEEDARARDFEGNQQAPTAGGEPDPEDTPPPGGRNASSSEKDVASQEGLEASPTQAAYEAPQGATASFEEPAEPITEDEDDIWPEGLEDVPAARENIHEEPQAPEAPEQPAAPQFAPAHDPAAVDARLNQLCNGRWLASPKGTTDPAWIDEIGPAGVDRHQIAQVVTLDRVEQFKREAMAERLDMQVANVSPIPQVCTLVIRKCEAYLAAEQQRRQLAERVPQAQPQQPAAAAARPVAAAQWYVGDVVSYCLDRYEVVKVTEKHLLLDSEQYGSAQINLNSSDINKVRLLSRPSLDLDIDVTA